MNPIQMPASPAPSGRAHTRSSLACLPCRSKHMKCDAKRPQCTRCTETAKQCRYTPSRRGGLDRAALEERRKRRVVEGSSRQPPETPPRRTFPQQSVSVGVDFHGHGNILPDVTSGPTFTEAPPARNGNSIGDDALIDAYYNNFHALHPFVLPRKHLIQIHHDASRRTSFKPLIASLRLVGYIYISRELSSPLREYLEACLSRAPANDPIVVQCRLLYSMALFWHDYKADAKREMDAAVKLALDLKMFRKEFAAEHGAQDPVIAESWRRTWWMVFVVDAYYTGTLGTMNFQVIDVEATTELPCEEAEYESGRIPKPLTLEEFDGRDLAAERTTFSSFAYLVGAVRCAALAISMTPKVATKKDSSYVIQAADPVVNGWLLLLPKERKEIMNKAGEIDELIFQAHMIIHAATIGFHRPLSDLKFNAIEDISSCAREPPADNPTPELINVHTVRVLRSVEAMIRLSALPMKRFHHTPFITCMISEATLALLSASNFLLRGQDLAIARHQVRMYIGYLKTLGELWPRTSRNVQEIQTIARHVLGVGSISSTNDDTPKSSDIPSLSSGQGGGSVSTEVIVSSEGADIFPPWGPFNDLCGWYNLSDMGQDLSSWIDSQS